MRRISVIFFFLCCFCTGSGSPVINCDHNSLVTVTRNKKSIIKIVEAVSHTIRILETATFITRNAGKRGRRRVATASVARNGSVYIIQRQLADGVPGAVFRLDYTGTA